MKTIISLIITVVAIGCSQAQLSTAPTPKWKVTLKVVDDTGKPVANAKASVGDGSNQITGFTDTNGIFIASHRDKSYGLGFSVTKDVFYTTRQTYEMGWAYQYNEAKWNPTIDIVLNRIVKPISMYAKSVNLSMPIFDKPAGYDFELGDWVGPYGKGINSDIIFTAHYDKRSRLDFDYKLIISFPKQGDGIQVFSTPEQGSELRSSHEAPEIGYQPEIVREHNERPDRILKYDNDPKRIYFFRVRTKLDENGNVVSAHYGKIYGDFMQFRYYLNPTPNDRNIEFDPKRNLSKNLSNMEDVSEP
jgi:hypothetical protein